MVPIRPFRSTKRIMIFTAMAGLELAVLLNIPYFAQFLRPDAPLREKTGLLFLLIGLPLHGTLVMLFNFLVLREDRRRKKPDPSAATIDCETGPTPN